MLSFPYAEKIDLISFALRVQESYSGAVTGHAPERFHRNRLHDADALV